MSNDRLPAAIESIELHRVGLRELREKWGWLLAVAVLLTLLGTVAIGASVAVTLTTMVFLGWLMIVGGAAGVANAFACKRWGGFFLDLLTGILYAVVGFMVVSNPGASAVTLTLLIAMFLIFGGIFRIAVAVMVRFPNWVWLLLQGIVNLLLGIAIYRQWPLAGLWVIGLFVGIELILNGWSLAMLALAARSLPESETAVASAS